MGDFQEDVKASEWPAPANAPEVEREPGVVPMPPPSPTGVKADPEAVVDLFDHMSDAIGQPAHPADPTSDDDKKQAAKDADQALEKKGPKSYDVGDMDPKSDEFQDLMKSDPTL